MMDRLKTLALIGAAILSALAVAAGPAWATYDQELTGEAAAIRGSLLTINTFTTASPYPLKCEAGTFKGSGIGSMTEPTTGTTTYAELTVHPTYELCKGAFGLGASWNTTGCNFVFTTATTTERAKTGFDGHAPVYIECESGAKIVITTSEGGCVAEFGEQTPSGVVDFKNEVNGTVTWQWTLEGIAYHLAGLECGSNELGSFTNGTLTGSVNASGQRAISGNPVSISVT